MSDFIELLPAEDMGEGEIKEVKLEQHDLMVARIGGELYVADARCPHLHGPLFKGKLDGTVLTCPWHGSQFDLTDGHCVRWTDWTGPVKTMAELVRHQRPLRVYEVKVEDGTVFVGPQKPPAE